MAINRITAKARICVLLSGGIDSTACLHFYKDIGCSVSAAFIDYGQKAAKRELHAAQSIARYYRTRLYKFAWSGRWKHKSGTIHGRNAFFLSAAMMEMSAIVDLIGIGVHSGTHYVDCSPPFRRLMQKLADDYTQGRLQIGTPFIRWNKKDIWDYCQDTDVPLDLTYSCENGLNQPCGKCSSCRDLEALYASSKI